MARKAGGKILEYYRGVDLNIGAKLNQADIVTAADKASEAIIVESIANLYPDHSILAEESGEHNRESEFRWVIDPLDGTTNFSAGLPIFAISIALQLRGETIVGVVYDPVTDELFTAVRGEGAYLNGRQIKVKGNHSLEKAVVSTGFPVDKAVNPDNNLDNASRVLPLVRGFRRLGSAAMDICYVAAGCIDAFWELGLHAWDVAAGLLILEEAGGVCHRFRVDRGESIIVGNEQMVSQLKGLIR